MHYLPLAPGFFAIPVGADDRGARTRQRVQKVQTAAG
jgi:hypothetical protein